MLAVLGLMIKRWGFKRTMLLGICAYLLRAVLFALVFMLDIPFAARLCLAGAGQALHGFCFGCFMAVGYMYVDKVAPADVRGSMQTLYGVFVLSLGFFVGGLIGGVVVDHYTTGVGASAVHDWNRIWLSCAALCVVCVVLFAAFFPSARPDESAGASQT